MTNSITNYDDTIDSRDVIARIEELQSEREDFEGSAYETEDGKFGFVGCESDDFETLEDARIAEFNNSDEGEELATLENLADEASGYAPDWEYGAQLIRYSYFEDAMDEMVADCYELPKDMPFWMTVTYDYDALKQDYTEVDFGGVSYFVR